MKIVENYDKKVWETSYFENLNAFMATGSPQN